VGLEHATRGRGFVGTIARERRIESEERHADRRFGSSVELCRRWSVVMSMSRSLR
jgi:hypothetical protein